MEEKPKPRIFLWASTQGEGEHEDPDAGQDVYAMAEDGEGLIQTNARNLTAAKIVIGLEGDAYHWVYEKKYPSGYQLVWLEYAEQSTNVDFKAAYETNQRNTVEGGI